jgi:hypothetical protein
MLGKKITLFVITISVIGGAVLYVAIHKKEGTHVDTEIGTGGDVVSKRIYASKLHSDILNLIATETEPVCGVSPEEAQNEIDNRADNIATVDSTPVDIKELPFGILRLIAKSPASIAGISPKSTMNEIVKRYIGVDLTDSDDMNSSILLEALQRQEEENIEKWADNEDIEAIEAFMREEADRDTSSVANFIYGLRHINDNRTTAKSYMERYAEHPHGDAFDTQNEEEGANLLVEAIKNLK